VLSGLLPLVRAGSLALLGAAFALALGASPASAEYSHGAVSAEFGPDGTAASSWGGLNTLAYQQASQRIYVLGNSGVYGFSNPSAGTFTPLGGNFPIAVGSSGTDSDIAVDNTGGASEGHIFWGPDGNEIKGWDSSGNSLLGFPINTESENCGIAVDNEGHIWGGRYGNETAGEWGPGGGSLVRSVPVSEAVGRLCKIAVDASNNDLYVSQYGGAQVAKLTALGGYGSFTQLAGLESSNNRIAVNGTRHVVYVGGPGSSNIRSYSTVTGELLESFAITGGVKGLAVQESTDTVFAASSNGKVYELRGVAIPKSTTGEPTGNTSVSGTANPDGAGPITECYFEFGLTNTGPTPYGSTKNCDQSLPINATTPVSATLPGLLGESTYHYRLVLGNGSGLAKGGDKTITPHNVKGLKTEPATEIKRTSAKLNGFFEGNGEETTYYFEYGPTMSYGSKFPTSGELTAGKPVGAATFSAVVSGLKPETTYHFRAVATNGLGVSPGKDAQFTTLVAVQNVLTEAASDVTQATATLNGSYNASTTDTPPFYTAENYVYYFEWGQTPAYGHKTLQTDAGIHSGIFHVSAGISGLTTNLPESSPYHYRMVVSNSFGTSYGLDRTFYSAPPDLPGISDTAVRELAPDSATLAATVNPGGGDTVYRFEYGTEPTYGHFTPISPSIGDDTVGHSVEAPVADLQPGTIYHFRVIAINFGGSSQGPDQTFRTPGPPRVDGSNGISTGLTTARLTAQVSSGGSPTNVTFDYGVSTAYGSMTSPLPIAEDLVDHTATVNLTGLTPGTTYHFRTVATNAVGTVAGADLTFTTESSEAQRPAETEHCKKGFVKRKGVCVRRKHRRKRRGSHGMGGQHA